MSPLSLPSKRRFFYRSALLLGDLACVGAALWAGFRLRFFSAFVMEHFPAMAGVPSAELYASFHLFSAAVIVGAFVQSGLYRQLHVGAMDDLLRIVHAAAKGWMAVLAATFVIRGVSFSRISFGLSAVLSVLFVFLFRSAAKALYQAIALRWWEPHRVLVIGGGKMAESVVRVLRGHPGVEPESRSLAGAEELRAFLSATPVREVFAGGPELNHLSLMAMAEVCEDAGVPFKIIPDLLELRMGEIVFDDSLGLPSFTLRPATLRGSTFIYKRLFDVLLCTAGISLLFFPFLFIACLIRIDSRGPILFHQLRTGLKGKTFPFFKFRSMVVDAEKRLAGLKALNERSGAVFKMKNDPRVTRVGRWLRKLSLDEFPQLLNVLRGEMSLVGPRPQLPAEVAEAGEVAKRRMNVLPGITGLWQVSGRAQLTYEQMIELDTYYIEHWSPGLDVSILLRTLPAILKGEGAY